MRKLLPVLLALTSGACALRGASTAAIAADGVTTALAIRVPRTVETNPLLGRRPSDVRIAATTGAAMAANWFVPPRLPKPLRLAWWAAVLVIEAGMTRHNFGVVISR